MQVLETLFPSQQFSLLAVVLLMPAIGAFVNGVFGKRLGQQAVRFMALAAIGISFLASLVTFFALRAQDPESRRLTWHVWHWLDISVANGFASTPIDVEFLVDPLNSVMMLVITGVGFLIHLYASTYMWHDERIDGGYHRFFAYLNLFCFAMLVLVMGANLPILFVGWEGVGLCSYLLIGFWYSDDANAAAGKKAFVANRIGDFGLLVAMSLLLLYTGSLDWHGIEQHASGLEQNVQVWPIGNPNIPWLGWLYHPVHASAATLVGLMLFLGCAGKSAQIPLYVWLPDAMAGPTPVSALIHAATMVTAGVYLVCRLNLVFLMSPVTMAVIAFTGALTALFAATIGLVQNDIKKVLAYSTVSQLGYMFLGAGVGAFTAGFFHVFTHAFFKACLFLGAGSAIHAMHAGIHDTAASQDMRNMGGLRKWMPLTHATFLVSCLAIAGFPFTSGFFSKDEILYRTFVNQIHVEGRGGEEAWHAWPWFGPLLYCMAVTAAAMTSFYMFRAFFLTFWGQFRGWTINPHFVAAHGHGHDGSAHDHGHGVAALAPGDEHERGVAAHAHDDDHLHGDDHAHGAAAHAHGPLEGPEPHESPWQMTVPLLVLGAFALFAGFLNAGFLHITPLEHWLAPVFDRAEEAITIREGAPSEILLMIPGFLAFVIGAGGAYWVYVLQKGEPTRALAAQVPALHRLVLDKWRIDELYEETVIGMVHALADTFKVIDRWVIDGILARLSAVVVGSLGTLLRIVQTGVVHVYGAVMVLGVAGMGWFFLHPQAHASVQSAHEGKYVVEAGPGLGYQYRWYSHSTDKPDTQDFTLSRSVEVNVPAGETKTLKLEVKNAFDRTSATTVTLGAPSSPTASVDDEGGAHRAAQ